MSETLGENIANLTGEQPQARPETPEQKKARKNADARERMRAKRAKEKAEKEAATEGQAGQAEDAVQGDPNVYGGPVGGGMVDCDPVAKENTGAFGAFESDLSDWNGDPAAPPVHGFYRDPLDFGPGPHKAINPDTGSKIPPVQATRFALAESKIAEHHVVPEPGTPITALLDPGYWAHVASRMKPWHKVIVNYQGDDGAWYAELIVRSVGHLSVLMEPVVYREFERVDPSAAGQSLGVHIKYVDPHLLYGVFRDNDKRKLIDGFPSHGAALRWAQQHARTVAA